MGVQISGDTGNVLATKGTYTGNLTVGGVLTYEDVTNVDSVGLVTARSGIEIGARPGVGASISVDGNAIFSGITTATTIKSTTGIVTTLTSTTLNVDGGDATFTGASANIIFDKSDDALEFNDDAKATFGTGADTTLTHSGADFAITNTTGNLNILNNSADAVQIRHGSETMIKAVSDGAVELYHDDSKKLETASGGVTVTGTLAATALTGDGSGLTGLSAGITMVDQWSITSDNNKTNGQTIDSNWERSDYFFAQIGSGMSESSGVFTFPSTGIYLLLTQHAMNTSASYAGVQIRMSSDSGSNYSAVSYSQITNTNNGYHALSLHAVVDVQNASTYRVKLVAYNSANVQYSGDSDALRNGITFIRLGDT